LVSEDWRVTTRELPTAALQTTLALADAETPQPVHILGGVVSPTGFGTAGEWQRSETLAEPQPCGGHA
jgi:hypothetical protein